jgi:cytosine/adenosine deaminase-related metal-dependent hydrolase
MKRFSAQYIFTNSGPALKRGIVTIDDDGTVTGIEDTGGELEEKHSVEFHNGIIIPGFVNCHCHLELSHMKGAIRGGEGLISFIEEVRNTRSAGAESIMSAALKADRDMYTSGVNLCADICNTSFTFTVKKDSQVKYINLLEVFGIDSLKAEKRIDEIVRVAATAAEMDLPFSYVPHSVYSLSLTLFRLLREKTAANIVTSIHFMESPAEAELIENHSGPLMESYRRSGLITSDFETVKSHAHAILNEVTANGNLILVHNTFTDRETIKKIRKRKNLYWCLCPGSNLYIEKQIPPVDLLIEEACRITTGTDSLASNGRLDILEELKTLQSHFPNLKLDELILWATRNGAEALGMEETYGIIATGKKPGLLLLQNADLQNMKLTPESFVTRLA